MMLLFWSSDISGLLESQALTRSVVHVHDGLMMDADQGASQGTSKYTVVVTAVAGSVVAAAVLVVSMVIMRMRRRRRASDEVVIIQDLPGFTEVS